MRRRPRLPSPALAIACLALGISLGGVGYAAVTLADNSVGTRHLKRDAVVGSKVRNHALGAVDLKVGELPAGSGGGWLVPNRNDIPCAADTVVASHTISARVRSKIWTFAQGTMRAPQSNVELGMYVRLRNAARTRTLGTSAVAWGRTVTPDENLPLATGGPIVGGADTEDLDRRPLAVRRGSYVLQLVAATTGSCTTGGVFPDFGNNQGSVLAYTLIGAR